MEVINDKNLITYDQIIFLSMSPSMWLSLCWLNLAHHWSEVRIHRPPSAPWTHSASPLETSGEKKAFDNKGAIRTYQSNFLRDQENSIKLYIPISGSHY